MKDTKARIIYERLYNEYGGEWDTVEEFAKEFDLTRAGIDYRRKNDTVDYDDIKRVLPEVNKDWLYSDNMNELKSMPVKTANEDDFEKILAQLPDQPNDKDTPYIALGYLLEALEASVENQQHEIQRLRGRIRKLKGFLSDHFEET